VAARAQRRGVRELPPLLLLLLLLVLLLLLALGSVCLGGRTPNNSPCAKAKQEQMNTALKDAPDMLG